MGFLSRPHPCSHPATTHLLTSLLTHLLTSLLTHLLTSLQTSLLTNLLTSLLASLLPTLSRRPTILHTDILTTEEILRPHNTCSSTSHKAIFELKSYTGNC